MANYVVSDTHFGHKMLVNAGHREAGFEDKFIEAWNDTILPIDTVFHLGDFSLGKYKEYSLSQSITMWRNQLAGTIILVRGNHDKQSPGWYTSHGFMMCADQIYLTNNGKKVCLSHEPIKDGDFEINIHGHLHGNDHRLEGDLLGYPWDNGKRYIDVSNHDKIGFAPILLNSLAG